MMRRCALLLFGLLSLPAFAQTGFVTITNSAPLTDGSGVSVQNGIATFQVMNGSGQQIGVHVGVQGGQAAGVPVQMPVNNGALVGVWQCSGWSGTTCTGSDPTANGTNLVPDPVIQSGWATWSNPGDGWTIGADDGGYASVNGFVVPASASGTQEGSVSAPITVQPGQTYTFAGYFDATNMTSGAAAWVVTNSSGTVTYSSVFAVAGQKGSLSTQFTVPTGVTQVYINASNYHAVISSGQNLYFGAPLLQAGPSQLPDTNLSSPQNACVMFTVTSNVETGGDGSTILGGPGSGYTCLQPAYNNSWCTNGVCDLSKYIPATTPGALQTAGPPGAAPNLSIGTTTTLSPGASATATLSGSSPNYTLSLGLPAGANGSGTVDSNAVHINSSSLQSMVGPLAMTPAAGLAALTVNSTNYAGIVSINNHTTPGSWGMPEYAYYGSVTVSGTNGRAYIYDAVTADDRTSGGIHSIAYQAVLTTTQAASQINLLAGHVVQTQLPDSPANQLYNGWGYDCETDGDTNEGILNFCLYSADGFALNAFSIGAQYPNTGATSTPSQNLVFTSYLTGTQSIAYVMEGASGQLSLNDGLFISYGAGGGGVAGYLVMNPDATLTWSPTTYSSGYHDTVGRGDVGLSRLTSGALALGDGNFGDGSGDLYLSAIGLGTGNMGRAGITQANGTGIYWLNSAGSALLDGITVDTSANHFYFGNGSLHDYSATITASLGNFVTATANSMVIDGASGGQITGYMNVLTGYAVNGTDGYTGSLSCGTGTHVATIPIAGGIITGAPTCN
ncbi:MAG TPA: hypothetical protein VHX37_13300 [Acidobacteriaceae bacterium]|jgi:hypothetical protein|nr:hypothetical protein [Acidobacteriaceae bacterium]